MRPFKGRLREEADALASQATRSADQERSLQALEEQILYIEKVEQTRTRRLTQEELERENKTLHDRLRGSASAHAAAAEAQGSSTNCAARLRLSGRARASGSSPLAWPRWSPRQWRPRLSAC
jgi:hypothetical protein